MTSQHDIQNALGIRTEETALPRTPQEQIDDVSVELTRVQTRQTAIRKELVGVRETVEGGSEEIVRVNHTLDHVNRLSRVTSSQIERLEFETASQERRLELLDSKIAAMMATQKTQAREIDTLNSKRFTLTHVLLILAIMTGLVTTATTFYAANAPHTTHYKSY